LERGAGALARACLEQRLGRTLMEYDFTDARVNDPFKLKIGKMRFSHCR
jgi:hypothetical protein